jgi:hypothetical protein
MEWESPFDLGEKQHYQEKRYAARGFAWLALNRQDRSEAVLDPKGLEPDLNSRKVSICCGYFSAIVLAQGWKISPDAEGALGKCLVTFPFPLLACLARMWGMIICGLDAFSCCISLHSDTGSQKGTEMTM